jgi:hypothetical protein
VPRQDRLGLSTGTIVAEDTPRFAPNGIGEFARALAIHRVTPLCVGI